MAIMKYNKYRVSTLICALLLMSFTANAQPTIVTTSLPQESGGDSAMTQMQYRQRVMDYSMQLKQAKENAVQAALGIKAIKTGMLPQLSGALDFSYLMKKIEFDLGGAKLGFKPYNYGATITAAQNVFSGGVVRKKTKVAEYNADIAISNEMLTIDNVIYNADYVYWSAAAINSYLRVAREYLEVVRGTRSLVKERYDNGLISKNDLLLIETRLAEAELSYSQVESNSKNAIIGLNMMMGVNPNDKFAIIEDIIVSDALLPELADVEDVLTRRPEYIMANSLLNQSKEELRITKSDYLPQVAVGVTGQYQTQSLNIDGKALLNGVAFAQVKVPIFAGNARKFRTAIDNSKIRNNEYAIQSVKDQVVLDVSTSWSTLNENVKQLKIAQDNLDIATQSLKLNSFSFNQGLLSIIDLMQAQLSWYGAYNSSIQANYNYRIALSQYNKAIGNYDRY